MRFWYPLFLLPTALGKSRLRTVLRAKDAAAPFFVEEHAARLTTEEWSRCLLSNETLTMRLLKPVILYDAWYKSMRRLDYMGETWDEVLELRDHAEDLDSWRFGSPIMFSTSPQPRTLRLDDWVDETDRELERVHWDAGETHGDRDWRMKLKTVRDLHHRTFKKIPSASDDCVYFLFPKRPVYDV